MGPQSICDICPDEGLSTEHSSYNGFNDACLLYFKIPLWTVRGGEENTVASLWRALKRRCASRHGARYTSQCKSSVEQQPV